MSGGSAEGKHTALLGAPAREHIRRQLRQKGKAALQQIPLENGLSIPSCRSVLPLLDLHGMPRAKVHLGALECLKDCLLARIPSLEPALRDKLLRETFGYISLPDLRAVPLAILDIHPHIPPSYLKALTSKPALLAACPLSVRRQAWEYEPQLFHDELTPLLDSYLRFAEGHWATCTNLGGKTASSALRRGHSSVANLVALVGASVKLYNRVLHAVRSRFLASGNLSYGTLRGDLIMALHDAGVEAVYSKDPVHVFAWGLDACVSPPPSTLDATATGAGSFDLKRAYNVLAEVEKQDQASKIDLDFGLIMTDPHASGAVVQAVFACLTATAKELTLPGNSELLSVLVELLSAGHRVRDRLRDNDVMYPNPAESIISEALPTLAGLMADDELEEMMRGSGDAEAEERALPPALSGFVEDVAFFRSLVMEYILARAEAADMFRVRQLLPLLTKYMEEPGLTQPFLSRLTPLLLGSCWEDFSRDPAPLLDEVYLELSMHSPAAHASCADLLSRLPGRLEGGVHQTALERLSRQGSLPAPDDTAVCRHLATIYELLAAQAQTVESRGWLSQRACDIGNGTAEILPVGERAERVEDAAAASPPPEAVGQDQSAKPDPGPDADESARPAQLTGAELDVDQAAPEAAGAMDEREDEA